MYTNKARKDKFIYWVIYIEETKYMFSRMNNSGKPSPRTDFLLWELFIFVYSILYNTL